MFQVEVYVWLGQGFVFEQALGKKLVGGIAEIGNGNKKHKIKIEEISLVKMMKLL